MDQIQRTEKVYHFANKRLDVKQQFLKAIRKAGLSLTQKKRSPPLANGTSNGKTEDCYVSSPDSGFPPNSVCLPHKPDPLNGIRPSSYYSSQSDAGYGSNSELHRKDLKQTSSSVPPNM